MAGKGTPKISMASQYKKHRQQTMWYQGNTPPWWRREA